MATPNVKFRLVFLRTHTQSFRGQVGVVEPMLKQGVWMLATIPAMVAGWTDWRSRRIPNWLTVPALFLGIGVNTLALGWAGAKDSLLGAGLGPGAAAALRSAKKPGRRRLEAGRSAGSVPGAAAPDQRAADNILTAGLMAVVVDHLEKTNRPEPCGTWRTCWLPCLRFICPDRSCRWITPTL